MISTADSSNAVPTEGLRKYRKILIGPRAATNSGMFEVTSEDLIRALGIPLHECKSHMDTYSYFVADVLYIYGPATSAIGVAGTAPGAEQAAVEGSVVSAYEVWFRPHGQSIPWSAGAASRAAALGKFIAWFTI